MLVLSQADLSALVDVDATLGALRDVLRRQGKDARTSAPASVSLEGDDAVHLPMLGVDGANGVASVKLLTDRPSNLTSGRPSQVSAVNLHDRESGALLAVLHGAVPTRVRTACATAIASDLLARPDADVLGLVGAGALAVEHVMAISRVRALRDVVVWSRRVETVARFDAQLRARWKNDGIDTELPQVRHAGCAEQVIKEADLVCTLTPSIEPIVKGEWFRQGLHVNAVGARPRPDERELDADAMHGCRLFVDHRETVRAESGDHLLATADAGRAPQIAGDLGQLLRREITGRGPDEQNLVTVYNSVGHGLLDTAIAHLMVTRARQVGIGTEVDFE